MSNHEYCRLGTIINVFILLYEGQTIWVIESVIKKLAFQYKIHFPLVDFIVALTISLFVSKYVIHLTTYQNFYIILPHNTHNNAFRNHFTTQRTTRNSYEVEFTHEKGQLVSWQYNNINKFYFLRCTLSPLAMINTPFISNLPICWKIITQKTYMCSYQWVSLLGRGNFSGWLNWLYQRISKCIAQNSSAMDPTFIWSVVRQHFNTGHHVSMVNGTNYNSVPNFFFLILFTYCHILYFAPDYIQISPKCFIIHKTNPNPIQFGPVFAVAHRRMRSNKVAHYWILLKCRSY